MKCQEHFYPNDQSMKKKTNKDRQCRQTSMHGDQDSKGLCRQGETLKTIATPTGLDARLFPVHILAGKNLAAIIVLKFASGPIKLAAFVYFERSYM